MNKLHPVLRRLLFAAETAQQSADLERGEEPSDDLVRRVMRKAALPDNEGQLSLLEFMVQRAAGAAAALGVVMVAIQSPAGEPVLGMFTHAFTRGALLFHAFLP